MNLTNNLILLTLSCSTGVKDHRWPVKTSFVTVHFYLAQPTQEHLIVQFIWKTHNHQMVFIGQRRKVNAHQQLHQTQILQDKHWDVEGYFSSTLKCKQTHFIQLLSFSEHKIWQTWSFQIQSKHSVSCIIAAVCPLSPSDYSWLIYSLKILYNRPHMMIQHFITC